MRIAVPVHVPTRRPAARAKTRAEAQVEARAPRLAFVGFALESVARIEHRERLAGVALLLARLRGAAESAYERRAVELRVLASPAGNDTHGEERATCYVLGRLAHWGEKPALRARAVAFGEHLRTLLTMTAAECRFRPLLAEEIAMALRPFPWGETGEIRRRALPAQINPAASAPLPLLGVPDIAGLVDLMLGEAQPTLLAFCFEPLPGDEPLDLAAAALESNAVPEEPVAAVARRALSGDALDMAALTALQEDATQQRLRWRRLAALRQSAFRMRIQLASAGTLSETLIASVRGEIGGPGRLTAEAAWLDPASPLAGGASWTTPRTARPRGATRTEYTTALRNLETLEFAPWGGAGSGAGSGAEAAESLADFSEAVRLFPLPMAATWLPLHDTALTLPYRGPAISEGLRLGVNRVRATERPVTLPQESRAHHLWVVGQTGTGKSTLLETLVLQDIEAGRGVILMDPHGDLVDQIVGKIPARRARDVILFDPADTERPLGINPLVARNEDEKAMVVSSFLALLRKIYDPLNQGITGPRFEHAARNGLLTIMSVPGGTLIEFMRAFTDDSFVRTLLPHITDPLVKRYWTDQIARTADFHKSEVLDWIVSKFGRFVTDPTIRRIVGQSENSFSFRQAMDERKIVLLSLAKGLVGGDNANFLGLVLLPMILHAALSRAELPPHERKDVSLFIDEFHNYGTDSLALMLAEARKYHLALTLANQHVGQLTAEVRDAVIGNVGSQLVLRVGVADAAIMEQVLAPSPVTRDALTGLPNFTAYGRLLLRGQRTPAFTLQTELAPRPYSATRARAIRAASRKQYGRARAEVDARMVERARL